MQGSAWGWMWKRARKRAGRAGQAPSHGMAMAVAMTIITISIAPEAWHSELGEAEASRAAGGCSMGAEAALSLVVPRKAKARLWASCSGRAAA